MNNPETKIGTIISLDIPQLSGHLSSFGFDFVFIDLEHGSVSDATIGSIVLSKKGNCKVFIRITEISESAIKHAFDNGCDGIIAPRIENLGEIQTLIDYSFYPPIGKRSIGFGLANSYGHKFKDYVDNFEPIILPQVESIKGLDIAKDIVANDRIAGIFMGPYDLSMSLGIPGQFESDEFKKSYESVRTLCRENNKKFGTFTSNAQAAISEMEKGTDLIAVGVDANLFLNAYTQIINSLKHA